MEQPITHPTLMSGEAHLCCSGVVEVEALLEAVEPAVLEGTDAVPAEEEEVE